MKSFRPRPPARPRPRFEKINFEDDNENDLILHLGVTNINPSRSTQPVMRRVRMRK